MDNISKFRIHFFTIFYLFIIINLTCCLVHNKIGFSDMNLGKSTVILTRFTDCEKTVMLDNIDESTEKDLQPKKKEGEAEEEQGKSCYSHMLSKLTDSFP